MSQFVPLCDLLNWLKIEAKDLGVSTLSLSFTQFPRKYKAVINDLILVKSAKPKRKT